MQFRPKSLTGINKSEQKLWEALKLALAEEPGYAYFGFRPRKKSGQMEKESDILLLHPKYGICVIECKGCRIDQIADIKGDEWQMKNGFYKDTIYPLKQAGEAMFTIANEINHFVKKELNYQSPLRINNSSLVALPWITRQQWQDSNYSDLPTLRGAVLLKEDLTPECIRQKLAELVAINNPSEISEAVLKQISSFCEQSHIRELVRQKSSEINSISKLINNIKYESIVLDDQQFEIASEIPPGPQRLRGLAGTGKTILFAKRAAKMHYEHPDWKIAFVFFTKSLYEQTRTLIENEYRELLLNQNSAPQSPDWNKVEVLHSWGGKIGDGFYAKLALSCNIVPKTLKDIRREQQDYQGMEFEYACNRLEIALSASTVPSLYDAIIIDEGQDLPPSFYRLAYKSLKEPKRLYWAYDEAQGLNSLTIPNSESIFGKNLETGELVVNLRGQYEGGAQKSYIMNSCYRTPRLLLMAAHAVNMGLFRSAGVLQGVTTKVDWKNLGYTVDKNSDFSDRSVKEGKEITITRPNETSPHEVDRDDFELQDIAGSLLTTHTFNNEPAEWEWIAREIAYDINVRGFDPRDILITGVYGQNDKSYCRNLKQALRRRGVEAYHAGVDDCADVFRQDGCVTISHVFRAKGNEAFKVYACRFNYADIPWRSHETILHKRNEAFTALTRSKAWCVVTGLHSPVFEELTKAITQYPNYTFPAFNKRSLSRITDDENSEEKKAIAPPKLKQDKVSKKLANAVGNAKVKSGIKLKSKIKAITCT